MKFVLRQGSREIELGPGRFIIGRAETAGLMLDDPLVSRHHAAVDVAGEGAVLRDLESRNGVRLNGTRVTGPSPLSLGDKIGVGSAELIFGQRTDAAAQTLVQIPAQRMAAFGLLGMLADKALGLGRGEEAEKLLGPQIEELLREVEGKKRYDAAAVERACEFSLRIAQVTGNSVWMDAVCRFYRAMRRLPPSGIVDELIAAARKVRQPNLAPLRAYLDVVREGPDVLSASERFLLGRLEGLERSLR